MRSSILLFAAVASLAALGACKKKAPDPSTPASPTFDERQACTADADCAVVELECCDHCNGGTVVGVHQDHAAEVRAEHITAGECDAVACTEMACAQAVPICRAGRCGYSLDATEFAPELPKP